MTCFQEFDFGQKRNWRRWQWNRIDELVSNKRDALVLYLAGALNEDLKIAVEHGFRPLNMLAVERDSDVIRTLRSSNQIAIQEDVFKVGLAWSPAHPISVCVLDLTCGLEPRVAGMVALLCTHPAFASAVFALNLQHGRDPRANAAREAVNALISPAYKNHRGGLAMTMVGDMFEEFIPNLYGTSPADPGNADLRRLWLDAPFDLNSYRSEARRDRALQFDSVVFPNPLRQVQQHPSLQRFHKCWPVTIKGLEKVRRKIAAALAVRTMRLAA